MAGQPLRYLHSAGVRRDDHEIGDPELLLEVVLQERQRREVIEGEVEEPLDLTAVQIDGDHPIGSGRREEVRHELRRDRLARQRLLVLPRVAVVRDDGGDALGRRALHRVDHHELLHDGLVDRRAVRLDHEHIGATDAVVGAHVDLGRREPADLALGQRQPEIVGDLLGQIRVRRPREEHQVLLGHDLHAATPCLASPDPWPSPVPCARDSP